MADETTPNTAQQKLDAEIAKIRAEEQKIETERQKLAFEYEELKKEARKRWYRKQTFQRYFIVVLLGAPLLGFYLNYVIIPVSQADVITAKLEIARTKATLDKQISYNDSLQKVNEANLRVINELRSTQNSLDSAHAISKNLLAQTLDSYNKNVEQLRTVSESIGKEHPDVKVKLAKEINRGAQFENRASNAYDGIKKVIDSLNTSKQATEQQLLKSNFPEQQTGN